jgi:predicted nucleotidyltransferase
MPSESSSTAPVTFLDATAVVERLRDVARRLCEAASNVAAVVLFGSFAHGRPTPGSDVDLLVVLRADGRRMVDRIPEYTRPFEAPGLAVQVLPWTEAEMRRRLDTGDGFAHEILATGVLLAGELEVSGTPEGG